MTPAEAMWDDFTKENNITNTNYQTRWFGSQDNPDEIDEYNKLIFDGIKHSTSKPLKYYAAKQEAIPQIGDYYILLDGQMKPVGIIKTVVSEIIPFIKISAEHAYHEGEGNRTLSDWKERMEQRFTKLAKSYDDQFSIDEPIVSETFELVYPK